MSYAGPDGLIYSVGETRQFSPGVRMDPRPFDDLSHADVSKGFGDLPLMGELAYRYVNGVGAAAYRQHIAQPVASFVENRIMNPIAATPAGQAVIGAAETLSARWNETAAAALDTRVGRVARSAYEASLGNPDFWQGIATTNERVRRLVPAAGAAALVTFGNAYRTGTLVQGTAVAGDPDAPAEAQAVRRALNIPRGVHFEYVYAEVPGLPGGRALAGGGVGSSILLPPSLGPGQPGAQPWIGPSTARRQITATSTAVATGPIVQYGWSFGTPNFNITQSANGTIGRAGVNVPRVDVGPGARGAALGAMAAIDFASFGQATVMNIGPGSILLGRDRDPVSPKVALGTSVSRFDPTAEGIRSAIYPVFSFNTGYNPDAPDVQALRNLWNNIAEGGQELWRDITTPAPDVPEAPRAP